jgi:hypothetical protein
MFVGMLRFHLMLCVAVNIMAVSTLESEAAFRDRAQQIGVEGGYIEKFVSKIFSAFGRYAFCVVYSPHHTDEAPLRRFLTDLLEEEPEADQMAILRRLFFESHTMTLTDARQRVEAQPDPAMATRRMATAERVARQREQQDRLGGLVLTPESIPANHLVDLFVDMCETGILSYVKPEQCCSRAQEVQSIKKDPAVSMDSAGMLKLGSKIAEPLCEANTELKLRSAWQWRNLAMDLAGLATFSVMEGWTQLLFSHLLREQPRGLAKVSLQQLLDCDRQLFTLASHNTMGNLRESADKSKPLDAEVSTLKGNTDILQYLIPLPVTRAPEAPAASGSRPEKIQKTDKGKGTSKGNTNSAAPSRVQVPEGCTSHDDDNKPLCFAFQSGKCKFKGPAGKRCARGFHKCYKKGCYRAKPYYLCTHTD